MKGAAQSASTEVLPLAPSPYLAQKITGQALRHAPRVAFFELFVLGSVDCERVGHPISLGKRLLLLGEECC